MEQRKYGRTVGCALSWVPLRPHHSVRRGVFMLRGIRGATTAQNTKASMREATVDLLQEMVAVNQLNPDQLAAAIFCVTPDLDALFPAAAAREMGWDHVPLLDHVSPAVPDALARCIRVLLLWNTHHAQRDVHHVYQRSARGLRPDLVEVKDK